MELENKIIFLLIAILSIYLIFTDTGLTIIKKLMGVYKETVSEETYQRPEENMSGGYDVGNGTRNTSTKINSGVKVGVL